MYNRLYLIICLCFVFNSAYAQEEEVINPSQTSTSQSEKNKGENNSAQARKTYTYKKSWSFGGNLGLSFWNGGTDILIAPKAYYNVSPMFLTGFGFTYIYSDYKDDFGKYNQNSFGPVSWELSGQFLLFNCQLNMKVCKQMEVVHYIL